MILSIALAFLTAQSAPPENDELIRASKDPYKLARFIDTHLGFDWNVLWKALGTEGVFMQRCGWSDGKTHCSTELIAVVDPDQIIVLAMGDFSPSDAYIRFLKQNGGSWKFSGVQEAPIHNHPRRHEVDRSNGTPFLRISSQGPRGSGLDVEEEYWFDLTRPEFEPAFCGLVEGYDRPIGGISRKVNAFTAIHNGTIEVALMVEFSGFDAQGEHALGSASFRAIYARSSPGSFKIQSAGNLTSSEFELLTDFERGISDEDLIRLDFANLKKIATSGDADTRNYLRRLLGRVDDTPEVRQLRTVLH